MFGIRLIFTSDMGYTELDDVSLGMGVKQGRFWAPYLGEVDIDTCLQKK